MAIKVLGLIPARGGSKGLPRKNKLPIGGKPLINWTIEAALASKAIDSVVVSTDDDSIAKLALECGARVPFKRPKELASDEASSIDVVLHALDKLEELDEFYEVVVLLEPTSPLRETSDIDKCLFELAQRKVGSIVSVCKTEGHHPRFMYRLENGKKMVPCTNRQPTDLRRQEIEPIYFIEGTLYCSFVEILRSKRSFYHEETYAYEVPKWKSLEIDDHDDFVVIEAMLKHKKIINEL